VLLADHLVERSWSHSGSQGLRLATVLIFGGLEQGHGFVRPEGRLGSFIMCGHVKESRSGDAMRYGIPWLIVSVTIVILSLSDSPACAQSAKPNFIVIFVDNLGNGDLGCFGSTLHRTPHVNRLAAEGTKFTSFYVASGVCTPSRASLMTGCYPRRVNMHVSDRNTQVLQPVSPKGLNPGEVTIAETLKQAGYATICIGKWHLGDQPDFLPTRQGFDEFFGIPYSDDMTPNAQRPEWPPLPLMRGERVIDAPVDRDYLVKRCTEEAVSFIERNKDRPFFLYLPHTMPGSTLTPFSSPAFRGKSRNGDYGDSVEELDWSTGEIMAALRRHGLDEKTLVIWTSDNGAPRRNPPQGSCAPYKGQGYDCSEGAMRMPCVMRWPGRIPAGQTSQELISTMDLLPTFAALAGAAPPAGRIDGRDASDIILGRPGAKSHWDDEGFFYYMLEQLQAVRSGPWKLYLPLEKKYRNLRRTDGPQKLELYDVRNDVGETSEVSAQNPEVVQRLLSLAERARSELGDVDRPGSGQRSAAFVENPKALVK
jgi:arylsulfatase A-like enzyme